VRLPDGLHWDVLHLWDEIKVGIAASMKNGVMSRSKLTVERAADRIENEDSAARYEYLNLTVGEIGEGLSSDEMRSICRTYNIQPTLFI